MQLVLEWMIVTDYLKDKIMSDTYRYIDNKYNNLDFPIMCGLDKYESIKHIRGDRKSKTKKQYRKSFREGNRKSRYQYMRDFDRINNEIK